MTSSPFTVKCQQSSKIQMKVQYLETRGANFVVRSCDSRLVENNMSEQLGVRRTADVVLEDDVPFTSLMLSTKTLRGLEACGFVKPSPIQLRAIPLGRCGFDLIVEAKSGTGKTAVFGIIALEMLIEQGTGFQILILAPTREIASQISDVLKVIGKAYEGLNVEIVMGGTNINEDVERLKKNKFQILVGSPGRILHLIKMKAISTKSVRLFVLDEADKLMEESFQKDINYIFSQLPERKQVIAASATYTPDLRDFLHRYMRTPSHVKPSTSSILLGVDQKIMVVPVHGSTVRQNKIKFDKLLELISHIPFKQCLVFCRYQIRAQTICDLLRQEGWPVEYLASSQSQAERLGSLKKLQTYACRILVATDLAARGIDATNVDLVVNLDSPTDYATYLHRIGRSGRFGSQGIAITIVTAGQEEVSFNSLLKSLGNCDNVMPLEISLEDVSNLEISDKIHPADIIHSDDDITNVDLLSLMTLPGNTVHIEPYENLLASFNEFVGIDNQKSAPKNVQTANTFNGLLNSLNEFINDSDDIERSYEIDHFNIDDHITEKNYDLQYYLKLNLQIPTDTLPITPKETCNNDSRVPSLKYNNVVKNGFNESDAPQLVTSNDKFADESSSVKATVKNVVKSEVIPPKAEKKRKKSNKKNMKSNAAIHYTNGDTLNQDFTDEDDSDDSLENDQGEQEYLDFKNRLEIVTNQIQHSVYISTLLKTD
ncbi:uncharacterized protein LOC143916456 [Arctopsyche grandis]|uniref:uncharacterized protein LOC143916456 n=1 Tax=Arctopsyche grandis TaxID=121162 RepID=UPI00406D8F9B